MNRSTSPYTYIEGSPTRDIQTKTDLWTSNVQQTTAIFQSTSNDLSLFAWQLRNKFGPDWTRRVPGSTNTQTKIEHESFKKSSAWGSIIYRIQLMPSWSLRCDGTSFVCNFIWHIEIVSIFTRQWCLNCHGRCYLKPFGKYAWKLRQCLHCDWWTMLPDNRL